MYVCVDVIYIPYRSGEAKLGQAIESGRAQDRITRPYEGSRQQVNDRLETICCADTPAFEHTHPCGAPAVLLLAAPAEFLEALWAHHQSINQYSENLKFRIFTLIAIPEYH